MDTRSKKWKTIISFLSFFLGVSLLLRVGIVSSYRLYWCEMSGYGISELMESDYQNTANFREYMQSKLSNFLAIAVGEGYNSWTNYNTYQWGSPLWDEYYDDVMWGDVYYYDTAVSGFAEAIPEEVIQETILHQEEAYADYMANAAGEAAASGEKLWKTKTANEDYLSRSREDMNLRYRISYKGEELYSNMVGMDWTKPGDAMPDGYNFLLYFSDGKVTIIKDGKQLDIYGDGIYRDQAQWCLPGYQNLGLDEDFNETEIVMLVAREPVYYSTQYRDGSYYWSESPIYRIAMQTRARERQVGRAAWELALGLVFVVVALLLRRGVQRARKWLAGVTGKIWFEAKLVLFLVSILVLGAVYFYYMWDIFPYILWDGELFYRLAEHPFPILACFWLWYLLINDLYINRQHAFHGIISRFVKLSAVKNLSLSFSRRLVRRFLPWLLFAGLLPMLVAVSLLCVYPLLGYRISQPPIFFVICIDLMVVSGIYLAVGYRYLTQARRQAEELDTLAGRIEAIRNGENIDAAATPTDAELRRMTEQLSQIQESMEAAVEERMKSERMKVELVANVSHDIRTPLTSIISYIEFLKQEEELPEHVRDYIRILDEKAQRLRLMVQDVFAVSKAVSGQLAVEKKKLDFGKLLRQTLADMQEQIAAGSVTIREEIPEEPVFITADGDRLYRVFQNLIENALKYSLDGSRVYVILRRDGAVTEACIKNTSRQELIRDRDFTERFVRGDESRTDGGSGLGLSIAKSFTEACGGQFSVETDADLFVVRVRFGQV